MYADSKYVVLRHLQNRTSRFFKGITRSPHIVHCVSHLVTFSHIQPLSSGVASLSEDICNEFIPHCMHHLGYVFAGICPKSAKTPHTLLDNDLHTSCRYVSRHVITPSQNSMNVFWFCLRRLDGIWCLHDWSAYDAIHSTRFKTYGVQVICPCRHTNF